MKQCIYCKKVKPKSEFPKHNLYKDKLDMRCRQCIKEQSAIRRKLHKEAPPRPEVCECCGKKPIKWCLDHNHDDKTFRGWICDRCNTGMGKLGDNTLQGDIKGLMKAVKYLKRCNKRKEKIKSAERQLELF